MKNNNKKINRPICRTQDKMTEGKKIELLGTFLDSDQPSKLKMKKINRPICRTHDKENRKNRVMRRFSRLEPTIQMKQIKKISANLSQPRQAEAKKSSYYALFSTTDQSSK
jgi:hypothetical protein